MLYFYFFLDLNLKFIINIRHLNTYEVLICLLYSINFNLLQKLLNILNYFFDILYVK